MKFRQVKMLRNWLLGGMLLCGLMGAAQKNDYMLIPYGLCALVLIGVMFAFWRCPHCGKPLGRTIGEYCPHCGEKLEEEHKE